jgi:hypothetical protein
MKKITRAISTIIIVAAIATASACKKDDTVPAATGTFVQNWSLGSTSYYPDNVGTVGKMLYATDSIGLISFHFASLPTSSGVYTVGDPGVASDQVSIEASNGTFFVGHSGSLIVTVAGGKISVDASNIWMLEVPMFTDSVKLSAHLTER